MNSETFDFNINNYSISDLENFLNLNKDYTHSDVEKKSSEFCNKIDKISDYEFKNKLIQFIEEVKDAISNKNKPDKDKDVKDATKNQVIAAGSTYIIKNNDLPGINFSQGANIATLKEKSITTTFTINTLFRSPYSNSATDCIVILPYTIKDVLSMTINTAEIPQSIYLFSNKLQSNTIYFKEYTNNFVTEGLVIFPQGNYAQASDVATMMETEINNQLNTGSRFTVTIDPLTYKTTITNSTFIFEMYIVYPGTNKNINKTMGFILGYRHSSYVNLLSYTSESIYNSSPADYLYIELNDYNTSQISTAILGLFNNSYLDKNILATLEYGLSSNYTAYNTIVCNSSIGNLYSKRDYFGPINLQKMSIRLLDKYGDVVDLNGLDYSFTVELKVLYDF